MTSEITRAALIKRINRKLAPDGERLRIARRWSIDCGWHFVEETRTRLFLYRVDDLAGLGRELGVLRSDEQLAAEGS